MTNTERPNKQYCIWYQDSSDDTGYFALFDTIEEAFEYDSTLTDGEIEIFEASIKAIGVFKMAPRKAIKVKTKRK